jgi:hypothetical protein
MRAKPALKPRKFRRHIIYTIEESTHETESYVSEQEEHHQHHPSAEPKTTTTLTAATSMMIPAMTNYNAMSNLIQQLHKQANQLT